MNLGTFVKGFQSALKGTDFGFNKVTKKIDIYVSKLKRKILFSSLQIVFVVLSLVFFAAGLILFFTRFFALDIVLIVAGFVFLYIALLFYWSS